MINGFHILYFVIGFSLAAYTLGKIRLLKQEARFWKENCFIAAERYNNLLVKNSMNMAIDKVFKKDNLKVN
tara:strand:+ start:249 stop:461 length:213 start_codon:yes stop_codon:yes gene_type:complete